VTLRQSLPYNIHPQSPLHQQMAVDVPPQETFKMVFNKFNALHDVAAVLLFYFAGHFIIINT
jgi:hypothetical protein